MHCVTEFSLSANRLRPQTNGSAHAFERERGDERRILASIARNAACGTLSFWRSRIDGRECNIRPAFIHKDQLLC